MKLLFSLTYYTPYVSGLTLYVKRLGEALVKEGYQVSVISFQHQRNLKIKERINKVDISRAKPLIKISKGFFSLDWLVKSWREVRRNDVVIVSLPQFEGVWPALFGKIFGKKVVSIYHCEVDLPEGIFNTAVEWLLRASHLIILSISDKIVTYTKDFADHSELLAHFHPKLEFVYPPILVPEVNKSTQKILTGRIKPWPDLVVGAAARLAAEKGIEYLLEAIPLIKNEFRIQNSEFRIVIAGSLDPVGEENYKLKILELVKKYKDYVVFLGELKEEEMGSFYSLLDVLALPSVNSTESFGMVQAEAMMAGVPVVATDLPGVRIPVRKTGMGKIVPIHNSRKLAEGIAEVLSNKNKFIKDKESIKKEFAFAKTVGFYKNLFGKN